jgi:ABC-2 type transport system ATP-binding protein
MDNAERLCDSVCIIARGEKVLDGTVSAVKSAHGGKHIALALSGEARSSVTTVLSDTTLVTHVDDQNQFFELELARDATPQQLLERLVAAGAPITTLRAGAAVACIRSFLQTVGAEGVEEGMSGQG